MNYSRRIRSIPLIFEKSLSKVKIGRLYFIPVAAIRESANEILFFCFNSIAIPLMSSLNVIRRQSSKRALQLFNWVPVIPGIPSNSISVTNETAKSFSVYKPNRTSPSNRLIKTFVSARKSIFVSGFLLIFQAIKSPLQCAEMFLKRRFLFTLLQLRQCLFNV